MDSTTHLREQVMINQFVSASGCSRDQAQSLLQSCNWQLESTPHLLQNTPATPESFPDLLTHFSTFKLNNGQSSVNSNSTSSGPSNTNSSGLDGKSQISPLVSHIQHHYHIPSSTHLVHNMK